MSEFQTQLEEEIEKRDQEKQDAISIDSAQYKNKKCFFSFGAFFKGLIVCSLFLSGILIWAWFKSEDTAKQLEEKLASKTAIVKEEISYGTYHIDEQKPVLTMPSADPGNVNNNAANNEEALVPAPVPGLYETVTAGTLPLPRKDDGLTPFEAYKRPFQQVGDKPLISFVVMDMGISRKKAENIIKNFPPEVSLAFSTYARDLKLLTDTARQAGHEVWLTLPMETEDYPTHDPGPSTLLVNASVEKNQSRLVSVLASTQGYAGFISQKDHVFKQEDSNVNPAIQQIFSRGLAVLDSSTSSKSFTGNIATMNDYPHGKNNFWLDDDLSPSAFSIKLRQIIEYGNANGRVIVMLRPYPVSLRLVQKFLRSPAAKGFQLAPVSAQISYGG